MLLLSLYFLVRIVASHQREKNKTDSVAIIRLKILVLHQREKNKTDNVTIIPFIHDVAFVAIILLLLFALKMSLCQNI